MAKPKLVVLPPVHQFEEVTADDVARLQIAVDNLRGLLSNPIALMERARQLLEGTAPRLLSFVSPVLFIGSALFGVDYPGPVDDAIRAALALQLAGA